LQEVGLGYLRLGQPINTLSGGESQRLKLVRHLAEATAVESRESRVGRTTPPRPCQTLDPRRSTLDPLFSFSTNPPPACTSTTSASLLQVFQRLVDAGHSVLVIEHNLDVIKCADWVIDLGPEAGDRGGQIVATGTPEEVANCQTSHTGQHLRPMLRRLSDQKESKRQ
jgi:excinuclease ABC subunit A